MLTGQGIPVVSETIPGADVATIGLYFTRGSRQEPAGSGGITHFIEHMFFKGTKSMSAVHLSKRMDTLGGQFDACTDKEFMGVQATVLNSDIQDAWHIIMELIYDSQFPAAEIDLERKVIGEEIRMFLDDPEDLLQERTFSTCWKDHELSRPILGSESELSAVDRERIREFHSGLVTSGDMILASVGSDHPKRTQADFSGSRKKPQYINRQPASNSPLFHPGIHLEARKLEQVHFNLAIEWFPVNHAGRYQSHLLNLILGGNMSSRLFQSLREQNGLVYHVGSQEISFTDAGMLIITAATSPATLQKTVDLMYRCFDRITDGDLTQTELDEAKACLIRNVILSMESSRQRFASLVRQQMYFNRLIDVSEIIEGIQSVSLDEVHSLAVSCFRDRPVSFIAVGPFQRTQTVHQPFHPAELKGFN